MFVGTIALVNLVCFLRNVHQVNIAVVKIADVLDRVLENRVKIVTTVHQANLVVVLMEHVP